LEYYYYFYYYYYYFYYYYCYSTYNGMIDQVSGLRVALSVGGVADAVIQGDVGPRLDGLALHRAGLQVGEVLESNWLTISGMTFKMLNYRIILGPFFSSSSLFLGGWPWSKLQIKSAQALALRTDSLFHPGVVIFGREPFDGMAELAVVDGCELSADFAVEVNKMYFFLVQNVGMMLGFGLQ
jgi:hypothetical protein